MQRAGRGLERLETGRREESVSEDSLQGANTGTLRTPVLARPQPRPKGEYQANNSMQHKCSWGSTLRIRTEGEGMCQLSVILSILYNLQSQKHFKNISVISIFFLFFVICSM